MDLDLLTRSNFLAFLKKETEERDCTILYATHILDNLSHWPSHLIHMHLGKVKKWDSTGRFVSDQMGESRSHIGHVVLEWLKEDLAERGPREGQSIAN